MVAEGNGCGLGAHRGSQPQGTWGPGGGGGGWGVEGVSALGHGWNIWLVPWEVVFADRKMPGVGLGGGMQGWDCCGIWWQPLARCGAQGCGGA